MKSIRLLGTLLLIGITNTAYSLMRDEVISRANDYAAYPWKVTGNNILDVKKYVDGKLIAAPDLIDDRSQWHRNSKTKVYESGPGNPAWWPFSPGQSINGVAYSHDRMDTVTTFSGRWDTGQYVVGRRDDDVAISTTTGKKDYIGIDCSAFVSNISGVTNGRWGTATIPDNCVSIESKDLKPGDPIVREDFRNGEWHPHVVVFAGGDVNSSIDIYQASAWSYESGTHVRRVIKDTGLESHNYGSYLTIRDKSVSGTGDIELIKHNPYTAFPVFNNDFSPVLMNISRTNPMAIPLSFTIRSKLRITTAEISIDGVSGTTLLKRLNEEIVNVTYYPDNPFHVGKYTVNVTAGNEIELTVSKTYGFIVIESDDKDNDGMPDEWEIEHGLDPKDPGDAFIYSDKDTLSNRDEYIYGTDPHNPDSDDDTEKDGDEVKKGKKPSGNPKIQDTPDYVEKDNPKAKDWDYWVKDIIKKFCKKVARIVTGRDPNAMYGPEGQVSAGQNLSYTIEFENVGEGIAYGVYVTDILNEYLEDSTLSISN